MDDHEQDIRQRSNQQNLDVNDIDTETRLPDLNRSSRNFFEYLILQIASFLRIRHNGEFSDELLQETINQCISLFKKGSFGIWTFYSHFFFRLYLFFISNVLYYLDEYLLVRQIKKQV